MSFGLQELDGGVICLRVAHKLGAYCLAERLEGSTEWSTAVWWLAAARHGSDGVVCSVHKKSIL